MKPQTKEKLQKFVKSGKFKFLLGTLIFLIVGGISFVVGAELSGWRVLSYLVNDNAFVYYFIILGILIPVALLIGILIYCNKNGRNDKWK